MDFALETEKDSALFADASREAQENIQEGN
jgi:hypothetical protein